MERGPGQPFTISYFRGRYTATFEAASPLQAESQTIGAAEAELATLDDLLYEQYAERIEGHLAEVKAWLRDNPMPLAELIPARITKYVLTHERCGQGYAAFLIRRLQHA